MLRPRARVEAHSPGLAVETCTGTKPEGGWVAETGGWLRGLVGRPLKDSKLSIVI